MTPSFSVSSPIKLLEEEESGSDGDRHTRLKSHEPQRIRLGLILLRKDIYTKLARDLHSNGRVPAESSERRTKSIITTVIAGLEAFRKYNHTFGDFPSRALSQTSKADFLGAPS